MSCINQYIVLEWSVLPSIFKHINEHPFFLRSQPFELNFGGNREKWIIEMKNRIGASGASSILQVIKDPSDNSNSVYASGKFLLNFKCFILTNNTEIMQFQSSANIENPLNLEQILAGLSRVDWISFTFKLQIEIHDFTHKHGMESLSAKCIDYLYNNLTEENICEMIILAHRLKEKIFFIKCVRFMKWNKLKLPHGLVNFPEVLEKVANILIRFHPTLIYLQTHGFGV